MKNNILDKLKPISSSSNYGFFYNGVFIGLSPEGVEFYIKLKKKENSNITLEQLVIDNLITSIEAYQLAEKIWDVTHEITEAEFDSFIDKLKIANPDDIHISTWSTETKRKLKFEYIIQ